MIYASLAVKVGPPPPLAAVAGAAVVFNRSCCSSSLFYSHTKIVDPEKLKNPFVSF
jgi:hypothetical protein